MARISKNRKAVVAKYNSEKEYSLDDATKLVKEITFTKFDASVDVDIRLGVDPKKSDQMVRGPWSG
jgi:large subunit ribosomal protein L1